jgi:predicted DCC family thiol-disulfide oxidoreductase YuxK
MKRIILFDGVCNLCNTLVQFIIKRDHNKRFKFASLQSEIGEELMLKYHGEVDMDSFVYIEGDRSYQKSTAALRVCKHLNGAWKFFYLLLVLPRPLRDYLYELIAKHRYKWFGKKESCMIPTEEMKDRFLF